MLLPVVTVEPAVKKLINPRWKGGVGKTCIEYLPLQGEDPVPRRYTVPSPRTRCHSFPLSPPVPPLLNIPNHYSDTSSFASSSPSLHLHLHLLHTQYSSISITSQHTEKDNIDNHSQQHKHHHHVSLPEDQDPSGRIRPTPRPVSFPLLSLFISVNEELTRIQLHQQ